MIIIKALINRNKQPENDSSVPTIDLNELKQNVVNGNEYEIQKTKKEIEKLKRDLKLFPREYCERYGHSFVTTYYERALTDGWHSFAGYRRIKNGENGWHSFAGNQVIYDVTRECTVCGAKSYNTITTYSVPHIGIYKMEIPESMYDDTELKVDGRTYRMIEKEIIRLEDYIKYRNFLKPKICEVAGHTMKKGSICSCICCGKQMTWEEYDNYLKYNPIILSREAFMQLPTFEEYQKNKEINGESQSESDSPKRMIKKDNTRISKQYI